jgi:hypothetical protein
MEKGEPRDTAFGDQTRSASTKSTTSQTAPEYVNLCGGQCGRYHLQMYAKRVKTLCEYEKDKM